MNMASRNTYKLYSDYLNKAIIRISTPTKNSGFHVSVMT